MQSPHGKVSANRPAASRPDEYLEDVVNLPTVAHYPHWATVVVFFASRAREVRGAGNGGGGWRDKETSTAR